MLKTVASNDLHTHPAKAVQIALSYEQDAALALADVASQIADSEPGFILLFIPNTLDRKKLASSLPDHFRSTLVYGCTTAGQITTKGYENCALVALAFRRPHFRVASALIEPLSPVNIASVVEQTQKLAARFPATLGRHRLAFVFADGLSKQEDVLVAALEAGLADVPVFGGSAGDGMDFKEAFVLHDGKMHANSALLLLLETDLPFRAIGFDHFLPTDKRMVVTRAVPDERLVLEINGSPAAQEYARLVGVTTEELSPITFAENPVLVRNGNTYHVRSIQQMREDGGLVFHSAIDTGLLLTMGREDEIVHTLEAGLSIKDEAGEAPDFILGFDCYLRKLEIEHKGLQDEVSSCLRSHRVVGFNTYGEQHLGVHVNQTFVGIAFFHPNGGVQL